MDKNKLQSLLIPPDTTMKQAMYRLNETARKILFVVDGQGQLIGTLTDGDIRRGIINGMGFGEPIESLMYRDFIFFTDASSVSNDKARKIMIQNRIEQIPILDESGIIKDVFLWTDVFDNSAQAAQIKLRENQVVIMAGGKGSRLDPFTKILPKPLIPLGNKPAIELIMEKFYKYGFHKFIYTLNYKKEYLKLFLKENNFPYTIDWIEEDDYLGTAGSLFLIKDKIKDSFFVTNCDSILNVDLEKVLNWHREHNAAMTVVGCHNEVKIPFGVIQLSDGKLKKISEKPVHDVIINTGVYVMEPHVISYICKGEHKNMNDLIDAVAEKEKVTVYPIYDGWLDIGQWEEYNNTLKKLDGNENL